MALYNILETSHAQKQNRLLQNLSQPKNTVSS